MDEHPQARFIVNTLVHAGFVAYYAGGWVRDFLLGQSSDDIDIATNASPEIIQKLFVKTVPIGISFGIILVIIEEHQYEVATFRNDIDYIDGRRPTRVEFTTAIEDAKRRDFTINGMFYDPLSGQVLDYVDGKIDLEKKLIRAIGNPHQRISEDRLRMIRAIRLACRLDFQIDPPTAQAIRDHAGELFPAVAIERIVQELSKGWKNGKLLSIFMQLHDFGLLAAIFPALKQVTSEELKERLIPAQHFSKLTPLVAYFLELFPNSDLREKLNLCKLLKLPLKDQEFTIFLVESEKLIESQKTAEGIDLAYFYANSWADISLRIFAAHMNEKERTVFLAGHEQKKMSLKKAVQRIKNRTPLITSKDLFDLGVVAGPKMGKLLREAEKIAINEGLDDKKNVLKRLMQHSQWKN